MSNREKNKLVKVVSAESQDDPIAERARRLTEIATLMDATNDFHKGQLVRWKPGLRNRLLPGYNEPAIIREVLPAPVYDSCERARCANSAEFREPLTLILAILDPDGDFVEYRYDARRFEAYNVSV